MQYGITKHFVGYKNFLEISKDEFNEAKAASRNLLEVLSIEEKFNLVLENYVEYEREMLGLSLSHLVFFSFDWSSLQNDIQSINRRLINLLTTCRLYMDHIPHNMNSIYGSGSGLTETIERRKSQEYDSSLSYRVMEALRNYVQHRGLPISSLQYHMNRQDTPSGTVKHMVTPSLSVRTLKEEKGFKASVVKELEQLGNDVDIKPMVRDYLDSIGRLHLFVRNLFASDAAKWEGTISQIQNRFRTAFGDDLSGLAIVRKEPGNRSERIQIFDDVIERRQWFAEKNRMLARYSTNIITNEVKGGASQ